MQLYASEHPNKQNKGYIHFNPITYYQAELKKIIGQVDRVFDRLERTFPNSEIIFICVSEREYWDTLTLYFARTINCYVKFHRQHRVINLNSLIPDIYLKRDRIHFKNRGYHYYMDKTFGKVYEYYWGPTFHARRKVKRLQRQAHRVASTVDNKSA